MPTSSAGSPSPQYSSGTGNSSVAPSGPSTAFSRSMATPPSDVRSVPFNASAGSGATTSAASSSMGSRNRTDTPSPISTTSSTAKLSAGPDGSNPGALETAVSAGLSATG